MMDKRCRILLLFAVVLWSVFLGGKAETRIVDLTHIYDKDSVGWPIFKPVNITVEQRGYVSLYKSWIEYNHISAPEHRGTHVDAPVHFGKGAWRTHQIPMERMFGRGVVINVQSKAANNPNYAVTIDDVKAWEKKHGRIPYGAVVVMNSGWYKRYPDKNKVYDTTDLKNISSYNFPGFHGNTTYWLITKRNIHVLGVDTPTLDDGNSARANQFLTHIWASKYNVIGIENLANLDAIPESGSMIYVPVPNIRDGSGGPSRVFATFDDHDESWYHRGQRLLPGPVCSIDDLLWNKIYGCRLNDSVEIVLKIKTNTCLFGLSHSFNKTILTDNLILNQISHHNI